MPMINTAIALEDLPPPPLGKSGWPWTEQIQPLPERIADGSEYPRISIVTPSYNYGQFIEETIRSVLLQGYPNLEYIIIDGGSTDETIEIIKKYEKYLTYWVSEPDKGQTDAINKGYRYCKGDIFAWLNADDSYANSNCLQNVADNYRRGYRLIVGEFLPIDAEGNELIEYRQYGTSNPVNFYQYLKFWSCNHLPQPAVFVATALANRSFPLDENIKMAMDYQFFLRVLSQNPSAIWVNQTWVKFKYHGQNKTMRNFSPDFDELSELKKIVLSEADKLPVLLKMWFKINVKDYAEIYSLINAKKSVNLPYAIAALLRQPTLTRWPLFWKVFTKKIIGSNLYSYIKQLTNLGSLKQR